MDAKPKRFWQIRLSTAIVMLFVATGWAYDDTTVPGISEARLKQIIANYDTIIIGNIKSVSTRRAAIYESNKWIVVIEIEAVIRGDPIESKQIEIYVHSPSKEFGEYKTLDDLNGRQCIWALSRKDGKIVAKEAPFQFQKFNNSDITALRRLLKDLITEKKL